MLLTRQRGFKLSTSQCLKLRLVIHTLSTLNESNKYELKSGKHCTNQRLHGITFVGNYSSPWECTVLKYWSGATVLIFVANFVEQRVVKHFTEFFPRLVHVRLHSSYTITYRQNGGTPGKQPSGEYQPCSPLQNTRVPAVVKHASKKTSPLRKASEILQLCAHSLPRHETTAMPRNQFSPVYHSRIRGPHRCPRPQTSPRHCWCGAETPHPDPTHAHGRYDTCKRLR